MAYNYYMTPSERQRYEQQRLFDTLASVGLKDPDYALGLALGRGLADSYGNNMTARQENKLDAFVNEQLSPSTKVQLQDEALKQMLQPDAQKEMISLANTQPGTMQPIGETKYIQTPQQQGFSAPSQAAIREFARNNGVGNNVVNNRMADYQEQIKERAREYYVPKIGTLVENGALTNNEGLAQLASELGQYGQYDPTGAKNITSSLSGIMNNATKERIAEMNTQREYELARLKAESNRNKDTSFNELNNFISNRQKIIDSTYSTDEQRAQAQAELNATQGMQNKKLFGANVPVAKKEPVVEPPAPKEEEGLWEKVFGGSKEQPTQNKVEQKAEQGGGYTFNVDNDIQRLNSMKVNGTELTLEQKKNFINNNKIWTAEQKAALLAKLK